MLRKATLGIWMWLLVGVGALHAEGLALPPQGDIRVLIDISGSMKKNDPQNLRRPALKLITKLIPEGSKAGVWTFGQYVNELVPLKPVNSAWRDDATKKAEQINSVALFTNIGGVLEKSFDDFQPGKDYSNTHFILLTDGVVDISHETGVNVEERERIFRDILSKYRKAGAKIHTIALSRNVDIGLLDRLALDTGGIASIAETSEELTRVFLQAFDRAAPAEEIPLEGNTFIVDSGVEEFTALIFRKPGSKAASLKEPTEKVFDAKTKPDYVNWFQEKNYDLITVKRPFEGEWTLDAELDAGSRITVVSNLRMIMEQLPANFFAGDVLQVRVGFFEDGQLMMNPSFLKLVDLDVTIRNQDGKSGTKRISEPAKPPADGLFKEQISKLKEVGFYDVIVSADGKTFKRQSRQRINLSPPLAIELQATGTGAETAYRVVARILSPNIDVEKSALVAKIKAPDGGTLIKSLEFNAAMGQWEFAVDPVRGEGVYEVSLRVDGKTIQGGEFRFDPDLIKAEFPRQEASPNEYTSLVPAEAVATINDQLTEESEKAPKPDVVDDAAPVIDPEALAEAQAEQTAAAESEDTEGETAGKKPNMILWIAIAGGVALTLVIGGLGFWSFKRKKAEREVLEQRTGKGKAAKKEDAPPPPAAAAPAVAAATTVAADELDLEDEIAQLEDPTDDLEFAEPPMDTSLEPEEIPEPAPEPETMAMPEPDLPDFDEATFAETPSAEEAAIPELEAESGETDLPTDVTEEELAADDGMDEEFNLEDFDIGDTDDLPDPDKK